MDEQQGTALKQQKDQPAALWQKRVIVGLVLALTCSLGLLAGVGLAYGTWEKSGEQAVRLETEPVDGSAPASVTEPPEESAAPAAQAAATAPATEPPAESAATEPPATTQPETEPPATEPPATEPGYAVTGYILPNSSTEYLSWEDYGHLSLWELVLARNEIFARHGRLFQDPDIQAYFNSCSWYEGTIAPENFDTSVLSEIEVSNVWTLKAAEG